MRILDEQASWSGEEDTCVARTMRRAHQWVESRTGRPEPFFLMVDTFDPHEPWNPPRYYIDTFDPGYDGDELFEPAYEPAGYASQAEIEHMRRMYAAEVCLVDRWIGHLLDGLKYMDLWDDTAVIVTSDHGFYHGEHGLIGKVLLAREGPIIGRWPLYGTIAQTPLIVRIPDGPRGEMASGFVQPPDLMPTILDLAGAEPPETVQGRSILPLLAGGDALRPEAITSCTYVQDNDVRCPTSFRTEEYLYIYGGDEWPSELYDVRADPEETMDLIDEREDVARELHTAHLRRLGEIGCPPERIEGRGAFRPKPRTELPETRVI